MSLQVKVGSFTQPTATGDFDVTGLGFDPVAVLFFYTWGSSSNQLSLGIGMLDAAGNQVAFNAACDNGIGTSNTSRNGDASACIWHRSSAGGAVAKRAVGSIITGGFRLNYTTADATSNLTVRYIAFGGAGVEAKVGSFDGGGSASQSVTGVGFEPEALFVAHAHHAANPVSANDAHIGFGMASSPSDQYAWHQTSYDNRGTSVVTSWWAAARIALGYDGGSNDWELALDAFTSDGFDLVSSNTRIGGTARHHYLAITSGGGGVFKVGSVVEPASASSVAETGVGFEPNALLFTGPGHPLHALTAARSMHPSWGASENGGSEWAQSAQDQQNAGTMVTRNYESATKAIASMVDIGVGTQSEADVSAWGSDGFTLNWTTIAGNKASEWAYMAFAEVQDETFIPRVMELT